MNRQAKFKLIGISLILTLLFSFLVYGIATRLESPVESFIDDDGYLDLQARCSPLSLTEYDGTTTWNITNATLYVNVNGTWLENRTRAVTDGNPANETFLFNFTNDVNQSAEGNFVWNVECSENNISDVTVIQSTFANNRTIIVTYADADLTSVSPINNFLDLDGVGINMTVTATPTPSWNLTNVSLFTNASGTWLLNQTLIPPAGPIGDYIANFTFNSPDNLSLADGSNIQFGFLVIQTKNNSGTGNEPLVQSKFFTTNRTLKIEYPPAVTLNSPVNNGWNNTPTNVFSFTPVSAFTPKSSFTCQFYTNETGSWLIHKTLATATNNTASRFTHQVPELSDVIWAVRCSEQDQSDVINSSINFTLRVDRTNPVVAVTQLNLSTIVNESFFKTRRLMVNFTYVESNNDTCISYINNTINSTTPVTQPASNYSIFAGEDAVLSVVIGCNDTAGNLVNSSTFLFTLDTIKPQITLAGNRSISGSADRRFFNFSSNEPVNFTIFHGTTVGTTSSQDNATFHLGTLNMTIDGFDENVQIFWNITACDRAGNCNLTGESQGQYDVLYPWQLLTGWSYYGIYHGRINFSTILNQTESEFVYYWNQTGQEFISYAAGGTTNADFQVGTNVGNPPTGSRQVVAIFEEVNSTWDHGNLDGIVRNTTDPGFYNYNFTTGANFIRLPQAYTFGNLSLSFLNFSFDYDNKSSQIPGYNFNVEESITPTNVTQVAGDTSVGGVKYNLTDFWFSAYNNTGVTWEPYYVYNFTLENSTVLNVPGRNEVVWIFSLVNITWNGTSVIGNWTV